MGEKHVYRVLGALECVLAVSLLPTLWALRASKAFFQTVPGELLRLVADGIYLPGLFNRPALSRGLLTVAARVVEEECALSASAATSSAYLLEAAGSGLGGIVASLVLLRFLGSFQIATIVAILNLFMATVLLLRISRRQVAALTLAAVLCAVPLIKFAAPSLDASQARLWRGFDLVASRDSIYGNLTVTRTGISAASIRTA